MDLIVEYPIKVHHIAIEMTRRILIVLTKPVRKGFLSLNVAKEFLIVVLRDLLDTRIVYILK